MIDSKKLLADLQSKTGSRTTMVKRLEDDLRARCDADPAVDAPLRAQYADAIAKKRTALTYKAWREEELTQIAVAWVLGCVFVRFLEDNGLVETPKLSGPGGRLQRARDEHEVFFRSLPQDNTDRGYLIEIFEETGSLPGMREFFDKKHNPLWLAAPSGDACRELLQFWQKTDPATGALLHDFTDPDWNTRFLGDLYQDLSEAARKKYALLQTPDFIESFILDRTLTPAIETFGYKTVRLIDPTCGSGHFLLGTFARLFRIWQDECPGENPRVLAQRALDGIYGVDLNPFAVAIARFRLLLAALQVSGVKRLKDAPDFAIHVVAGDSLLHGRRFRQLERETVRQSLFETDEEVFSDELKHHYEVEDTDALHRILGQQYHAVVGNPPYITVKDKALNELYRQRYPSCHRKYALSVPFMERFFDLAVAGSGDGREPAGYTGQITANSFMKREFGKKLVEVHLRNWDLTHVLDTSGAYIPGHGTPTVILFGKNQKPDSNSPIRTVLGIRGEPATPEDPAQGIVWQAILRQIDQPGTTSEWMSAADTPRVNFLSHPWSIGGGGAAELKDQLEDIAEHTLLSYVEIRRKKPVIGFGCVLGEDEVFQCPKGARPLADMPADLRRPVVEGDLVRDWSMSWQSEVLFPYTASIALRCDPEIHDHLWPMRALLESRNDFGKVTYKECDRPYWEYHQIPIDRNRAEMLITFGEITTHNHFVLNEGSKVFKQTAPVIKLKDDADRGTHLKLLGILNSSAACFWLKQTCFPKGGDHQGSEGARVRSTLWDERYAFNSTQVANLPIPSMELWQLPNALEKYSRAITANLPPAAIQSWAGFPGGSLKESLDSARWLCEGHRLKLIAWQEELDWQVYEAFGLIEPEDQLSVPEGEGFDLVCDFGITLGQRAFEIVLARRMAAGEQQTTWFARHGSTPITEVPAHWPAAYRDLVERRIIRIESDANLRLIEQPEYKRRWNTEPWEKSQQDALRQWLLARLESYFHEGSRVCDLAGTFDPASHGFTAAARPHLVSANQLADVVQSDARFLEAAEVYEGAAGFSVPKLIRSLVESESVPALPRDRYKDSGLRNHQDWEQTWRLQRVEDEIDAEAARLDAEIESRIVELVNRVQPDLAGKLEAARNALKAADLTFHNLYFPQEDNDPENPHHKKSITTIKPGQMSEWLKLDSLANALAEVERQMSLARIEASYDDEVLRLKDIKDQLPPRPDIAVPPKYAGTDFKKTGYWKLRGKLDVPKERWICYPGAERAGDDSQLIAWAGWDHYQQAQALAEYFIDAKDHQGWPPARLKPLLAALADLIPWLKQWHNTLDPDLGVGLGDYFADFLEQNCRELEMTVHEVDASRFDVGTEAPQTTARKPTKARGVGRKGATADDVDEALDTGTSRHWQDQAFTLLAPVRKPLRDYRMLVWPELLRQMPGDMEFETFRKAYWLLSEPEELKKMGSTTFPEIPASWWRSRTERLAKDEFLDTLKGAVTLGDLKIWRQDSVRFVRWLGGGASGDFPEAVDDARIALQLASLWSDEEADAVRQSIEPELVLLETP
jgi:hypothetical protein